MVQTRNRSIQLFCEEPFRLFFPVGLTLGIIGVSLWPLYYAGLITMYPATAHARLMIEGFMASFIIGFLGTAGPRITSTRHFSRGELFTLVTLDLLSASFHFGGADRTGDALFVLCLGFFLFVIGRRFVLRKDSPPPNFVLVALGLLSGLAGTFLLSVFENEACAAEYRAGASLLLGGKSSHWRKAVERSRSRRWKKMSTTAAASYSISPSRQRGQGRRSLPCSN